MKVKHMTFLAMYTTIALTIFVVEAMLPPLAPIPGIKLGLANVRCGFCIMLPGRMLCAYF